MQQGWIKLYRQIQDNEIWTGTEPFDRRSAFIDLLLQANRTSKTVAFNGGKIELKAGQRITSIRSLAKRWNWSKNKVSRYLDYLESAGMIEKESDQQKTIITIKNYKKYQENRDTNGDTDGDTNRDTDEDSGTRTTTGKNRNLWDTNGHTNRDTNRDTNGVQTRNKEIKKNNNIYTSKEAAKRVVDLYTQNCPSLPQVAKLTDARVRSINARLKEYTEEEIAEAFRKAEASPFLRGDTGRWRASFDWIMKPGNLPKILEGNYNDRKEKKKDQMLRSTYDFDALQKFIREN